MSNQMLILVADDTDLGRWALAHALRARGFEVCTAATWLEASEWLGRHDFCAAIVSASLEHEDDQFPDLAEFLSARHQATRVVVLAEEDETRWVRTWCGDRAAIFTRPVNVEAVVAAAAAMVEDGRRPTKA